MTTEQLKELYLTRQSCRAYSDKKVSKEQLKEICALAGLSPSACNLQPWTVYALTGEKLTAAKALLKNRGKAPFVGDVPAILVITEDSRPARAMRDDLTYYAPGDTGLFTAHLILAAEAAGLSTCLLGWQNAPGFKELLSLSDEQRVPYVLAVGYKAEGDPVRPKKRKSADDFLFFAD